MNKWQRDGVRLEFLRKLSPIQENVITVFKQYLKDNKIQSSYKLLSRLSLNEYLEFCDYFAENYHNEMLVDPRIPEVYFKCYGYKLNDLADYKHAKYTVTYAIALANLRLINEYLDVRKIVDEEYF